MHYLFLVVLFVSLACTKPLATPAAPKTVLDEAPPAASQAVCGDGIVQEGELCDDGNQIEMGTVVEGDMDNCSNACEPLTANHIYALENADKEAQKAQTVAQWEAQRAAMEANFKGPLVSACFVQETADRPSKAILAEVAKHLGLKTTDLAYTREDLDGDGRQDWFVNSQTCSSPFGCMGSAFIPSDCAPGGFCYAASGHPAVLQTQPKLKCRTRLQVDETETGISDPYCTFWPLPKACADPPE